MEVPTKVTKKIPAAKMTIKMITTASPFGIFSFFNLNFSEIKAGEGRLTPLNLKSIFVVLGKGGLFRVQHRVLEEI